MAGATAPDRMEQGASMRRSSLVCHVLLMLFGAPVAGSAQTSPPSAPAAPAPLPFAEALQRAAGDLFSKAQVEGARVELVIDPDRKSVV